MFHLLRPRSDNHLGLPDPNERACYLAAPNDNSQRPHPQEASGLHPHLAEGLDDVTHFELRVAVQHDAAFEALQHLAHRRADPASPSSGQG